MDGRFGIKHIMRNLLFLVLNLAVRRTSGAAIGRILVSFRRIMTGRPYVTDIILTGMPTRSPSMLLYTIIIGPNTYMGVSRACDEALAAPSSVSRALLNPFLRGVTFFG
jgi:hypothetical protein